MGFLTSIPVDQPIGTMVLVQAARHGKGNFLLMTFKEVFENISAGGLVGTKCAGWCTYVHFTLMLPQQYKVQQTCLPTCQL